jgi:BirA family biotin operon repressor/biotin-[acetyl-CoA-carboxylase] ligase
MVVARSQSAGVGRMDRRWSSPRGGLYLSVVVDLPGAAPGLLPLAIASHLRSSWEHEWGADLQIKWPNDLVVAGSGAAPRKVSGILLDRVAGPAGTDVVVVGVGVNVARSGTIVPPELRDRMAFLQDLIQPTPGLDLVEATVVRAVSGAVHRLESPDGAQGVVAECRTHLFGVGRPVVVDGTDVGVLRNLAEDGAITVERDGALTSIYAGDVGAEAGA